MLLKKNISNITICTNVNVSKFFKTIVLRVIVTIYGKSKIVVVVIRKYCSYDN